MTLCVADSVLGRAAAVAAASDDAVDEREVAPKASFKQSSSSFLRRRLGRGGGAGCERDQEQSAKPRRQKSRFTLGLDAMNARIEQLAASQEGMRREVSELVRLLNTRAPDGLSA